MKRIKNILKLKRLLREKKRLMVMPVLSPYQVIMLRNNYDSKIEALIASI